MLRSHILQHTHITITFKTFLGVFSDVGERELWRAYNYVRNTTGYFVCVRRSYIHMYVY